MSHKVHAVLQINAKAETLQIILQEFQYGKDVFQTTTNKYQDTYLTYVGSRIIMMRMVNSLFVWLW